MTPGPEIAPEDVALLDRLAARIVELRLETPAILALETARPLSLVAGQAMVFLEPIVQSLFRLPDYRRFAALVERRECLGVLVDRIEARAAGGHDASEANLAVLDRQLAERDPLAPWERRACVSVDTEQGVRYDEILRALARR